jgi:hypothetical protein
MSVGARARSSAAVSLGVADVDVHAAVALGSNRRRSDGVAEVGSRFRVFGDICLESA